MEAKMTKNNVCVIGRREMMRIGIASDFGWFELKRKLIAALYTVGYEIAEIDAYELIPEDNFPDFVVPLAKVVSDENDKQSRIDFGNGVEACAAVNKIPGVCAAIIKKPDTLEVEDEDLYVRCLGGQIKGYALSNKKVMTFLNADCPTRISSNHRLAKVRVLKRENKMTIRENYTARRSEYIPALERP
jgi:ribose 5-phosphate isomerase B